MRVSFFLRTIELRSEDFPTFDLPTSKLRKSIGQAVLSPRAALYDCGLRRDRDGELRSWGLVFL